MEAQWDSSYYDLIVADPRKNNIDRPITREVGTQTIPILTGTELEDAKEAIAIRKQITSLTTAEETMTLLWREWPDKAYCKTWVKNKNILRTTKEEDLAICITDKDERDQVIGIRIGEMYGELFRPEETYYEYEHITCTVRKSDKF